jgi:hypothetical protein
LWDTFSDADISTKIQIVWLHAEWKSISDSITSVFPHLWESRKDLEQFYSPKFLQEFERLVPRANRPNQLDPSIQISEGEYLELLENVSNISGVFSAYLVYLLDQEEWFVPKMSEQQFYEILQLAQVSFDNWDWGRDDERRHVGKTRIALEWLLTQGYAEFNSRMWDFFETIGFEEAAQIHPEIQIAYTASVQANENIAIAEQRADEANAEADESIAAANAEADRNIAIANAEADEWKRTRELLGL